MNPDNDDNQTTCWGFYMNRFLRRKLRPDSVTPSSRQDGYIPIETVDPALSFDHDPNQNKKTVHVKYKKHIGTDRKIEQ